MVFDSSGEYLSGSERSDDSDSAEAREHGVDLSKTLPLQGVHLDHTFGGLIRNARGEAVITLTSENGESTSLTVGESIK